ncbi:polysaccharide pyruvyl transferase family protein [Peribacillus sp. NPDC097197]|uniref:polysaccharide pyruvyl transferase family protein n=1 Tax=Peribacillus sp. NPDC097197 TaxID=3390615 RepID=UPI003D00EF02
MKKVLVDVYLQFNLGDDLFLDILANKYPNTEFTINYIGRNYDQFIAKYPNVKRRQYNFFTKVGQHLKFFDYINNYKKLADDFDALIFIGGSIFREEDYHDTLYRDRMQMVNEFKRKKRSVFIIGANFGPYNTNKFLNDYTNFFKLCDDVCFRDMYSYNLFKTLPQVRYAPDIVFQMNLSTFKKKQSVNRVGFSVIDVRHKQGLSNYYNDYINSTVKSIEMFLENGYQCTLISFCEHEGDLRVINTIKSKLSTDLRKNVSVYSYKGNIGESLQLISTFKLFIAARFHANILGLLTKTGLLPIIYSQKTENMLKDINLDKILVNMNELHLQYSENILREAFKNKTDLSLISQESEKHFKILNEFLESPKQLHRSKYQIIK